MTGFSTFGLSAAMLQKLEEINFTAATPVQEKAIPLAMEGKDVLATAQTGTGKTAAFGLPLVHHLMNNPHSTALVMTPTRELAVQVMTQIKLFLPDNNMKFAVLIGGESILKQLTHLKSRPRIIVGTPGRINDHLERNSLTLKKTDFLVLDEADRMLDMGFGPQLEAICKFLPEQRQTLMFSATVPPNIMKLAGNYLKDPVRVETAAPHLAAPKIKQELIQVKDDAKHDELVKLLDGRSGQIIVFVKTKHGADRLARKLARENHAADAIHGHLRQGQRDRVIRSFRKNDIRILIATDVAARGLDIPLLETVINYDLPQNPEDYIHRIGRTGRNGAEGEAICLISGADKLKWAAIDRLMNPGKPREKSEGRSNGGSSSRGPKKFGARSGSGFGKRSFGDKPAGDWKSSFKKDGKKEGSRDGAARPARREWAPEQSGDRAERPARTERPFRSERPAGANAGAGAGERSHNFAKKKTYSDKPAFGGASDSRSERPAKKWSSDRPANKDGGFRKDGPKSDTRSAPRDGAKKFGDRKEGSRDTNRDGAKKFGAPREGGFKSEGGYKKAGGFNQAGPRKPRPARSA